MSLRLEQGYEYLEDDRWKWWAWIEAPDEELDRISSVEYILHPTFPDPVRPVTDRATKFRLETSGWGTFTLFARVHRRAAETIELEHELVLEYPDEGQEEGAPTRGGGSVHERKVFVHSGSADAQRAALLADALADRGIQRASPVRSRYGTEDTSRSVWQELEDVVDDAAAVVLLVSSVGVDTAGAVIREADDQHRPILVVLFGPETEPPTRLADRQIIRAQKDDLESLADEIVAALDSSL